MRIGFSGSNIPVTSALPHFILSLSRYYNRNVSLDSTCVNSAMFQMPQRYCRLDSVNVSTILKCNMQTPSLVTSPCLTRRSSESELILSVIYYRLS